MHAASAMPIVHQPSTWPEVEAQEEIATACWKSWTAALHAALLGGRGIFMGQISHFISTNYALGDRIVNLAISN